MERENLGERIGVSEELIKRACSSAMAAHRIPNHKPYLLDSSSSSEVIFSFPGSWTIDDWFTNSSDEGGTPFRETKINLKLFPSLKRVGQDQAAKVNESFLSRFEALLINSTFKTEVDKITAEKKGIICTGHSLGAPIAIFATLWLLENQSQRNKQQQPTTSYNNHQLKCITFGSPLIGNDILHHATKRENWAPHFTHFITKHDIIPRVSFSPLPSIQPYLSRILHYINPNSTTLFSNDFISKSEEASAFFFTVMRNASPIASHEACKLVGSSYALLDKVEQFVQLSPYRPFGTQVFCTGSGKLVVIDNPDAILQVLFYSLQFQSEAEEKQAAHRSLRDHLSYESEVLESLAGMQSVTYLDRLDQIPLSAEEVSNQNAEISAAVNDLSLSTPARMYLKAAGELQTQKTRNRIKIENNSKPKIEEGLRVLQTYQKYTLRKIGYYDAFRNQTEEEDFKSNVKRVELAGIWDEIIEMLWTHELPDACEGKNEWIDLATRYRQIVEPLDIANYYRHSLNEITGPYMGMGRPNRYRFTQRWLEHHLKMEPQSIPESCFWAEVEELRISTSNKEPFECVRDRIVQLETSVLHWVQNKQLERYVFLNNSTFAKWWKTLPNQHRISSCIANLFSE